MRIAINALPLSEQMTGIGSYTLDLLNSTRDFGGKHEYVYVITQRAAISLPHEKKDLRKILVDSPNIFWENLHLPTELAFWKSNLYHSPLFTCPIINEIPNIITVHDVIPEVKPSFCSPEFLQFYRTHIGRSIRAARWIVTTSEFSKEQIVKYLPVNKENVHVVYQGISERFSPENAKKFLQLQKKMGIPNKYFLYVGMLEPRKNLERLIEAYGRIAKTIPEIDLVIVGRKDQESFSLQESIQKMGVERRIRQLGYVGFDDLAALYACAHGFLFPSLYEGFGRPVIEAMASGTPVLTSNSTSLPEIAGGAALLVDPENVESIANGLLQICQDETLRKALIERGIQRAQNFTYTQFGKRLCELYNRLEQEL